MAWTFNNRTPVFRQLEARIRAEILGGKYRPEEQIPSVRQIAFEASVNPNTVQHAFSELETEGLLVTRGTLGRFVTSDPEVLREAREKMIRGFAEDVVADSRSLGIRVDELLRAVGEMTDADETKGD